MSWQDKDEQDAGLNRGLPKWVLIVGVVIALIIVGAIVKNCRGNKGSGSSRSTTLDTVSYTHLTLPTSDLV